MWSVVTRKHCKFRSRIRDAVSATERFCAFYTFRCREKTLVSAQSERAVGLKQVKCEPPDD